MEKIYAAINRWLEQINQPLMQKHPLLWVQGYPWQVFILLLMLIVVLLSLQIDTWQPGTYVFTLQILFPFLPLLLIWAGIGYEKIKINTTDYYSNYGSFLKNEENKVLLINFIIVIIPFLICINNIYERFDHKRFLSSTEYNESLVSRYIQGEYYFLKKEGLSPENSLYIFRDSIYPFLNKESFLPYDSVRVARFIHSAAEINSNNLLRNYSNAFNHPLTTKEGQIKVYRRSYSEAVTNLNDNAAIELPALLSALLYFMAIYIAYRCLTNMYFKYLMGLFKKRSFHENIALIFRLILYSIIISSLINLVKIDIFKGYIDIVSQVNDVFMTIAVVCMKIFNVLSVPVFLYYYFEKFTSLKLELLGQSSKPLDSVYQNT